MTTTATDAEIRIWASVNGVPCPSQGFVPVKVRLRYFDAQARQEEFDDDPGYRDFPYENSGDPAFCDVYTPHAPHVYVALNSNLYSCGGWTVEDAKVMEEEANRPPCEHGLSQALCAGPGHYPMDEEF